MLAKKADRLRGGIEKEARHLADQPRQQRAQARHDLFKTASYCFASGFQSVGDGTDNSPDRDTHRKDDRVRVTPYFLKFSRIFSRRGMAPSLFASCVCKRASFSFLSAMHCSAISLSEGKAFESSQSAVLWRFYAKARLDAL